MGYNDNRCSIKMRRRKRQRKFKERQARRRELLRQQREAAMQARGKKRPVKETRTAKAPKAEAAGDEGEQA